MSSLRFPLATLAAILSAAPAIAQAAPIQSGSVRDIEVSREGDKVSILLQFSQQPVAADARASADGLQLDIDGLDLLSLQLDPPAGSLVSHVEAGGRRVTLSGAAFSAASTVIYRNAVMVEARLAEPPLRGASIMPASASAPASVVMPQPKPAEAKAAAPVTPAAPISLLPPKHAEAIRTLESRPLEMPARASPAPAKAEHKPDPSVSTGTAGLAGIDAARCAVALTELDADAWSVAALGDHALCLLDQGKPSEAASRLDQLAAFAPEDWRIALGRAALAAEKGDASNAEIGYRSAAMLAPDENVRAAIATRIAKPAAN